jgi:CelD/BcsL family acetyltransferase involved in cellulose biosynthesis
LNNSRDATSIQPALKLERLDPERVDWQEIERFPDRNVFQTPEWPAFTAKTQQAEPVLASVKERGETVGVLTGLIVRRYGVRILGSPFQGWMTGYQGFNLRQRLSRRAVVQALLPFTFETLRCMHLEIRDRQLTADEVDGLGFERSDKTIFEVDLRSPETRSSPT